MITVFVRYYDPAEVMDDTNVSDEEIKKYCFIVNKYNDEASALMSYANTMCTWSTLLDDSRDIDQWIDEAYKHIKSHDIEWLEQHFV